MKVFIVLVYLSIVSISGLKVIGAGMSRTGTRTLKKALEILYSTNDYRANVYHADIWLGKMDHIEKWTDYFDARINNKTAKLDLSEIYGPYEAATDVPTAFLWRELIEEYPNAKVILTIREENKWFRSYCNAINAVKIVANLDPKYYRILDEAVYRMMAHWIGSTELSTFDPFMPDNNACQYKELYMGKFNKHNKEVIQGVPKENLLIMNIADGHYDNWDELCAFLNLPIPSVPFPNTNKGNANEMLEASKPKISFDEKIEEIYIPSDHFVGQFSFDFLIFCMFCTLIYAYVMVERSRKVTAENLQ
jgi:hypothetical protein